jgi:glucose/arabinose dehydrogenase
MRVQSLLPIVLVAGWIASCSETNPPDDTWTPPVDVVRRDVQGNTDVPPGTDVPIPPGMDVPPGTDVPIPPRMDVPTVRDVVTPADVPADRAAPGCTLGTLPTLTTTSVAGAATFDHPIFVTQAPGSSDTLWVVERSGRIRLVRGGAILPTPFLDVSSRIATSTARGEECGLLGLAFHPDYVTNGRFFVYYCSSGTRTDVLAEYHRGATADVADGAEVRRLVALTDPEGNHNGGMLAFGPDRFLYASIGDGGGAGDVHGTYGNGLNTSVLFGKILRLDVDNVAGMFAAAGNPFSGASGLPQIWAYGLRNPWRFSFDRMTGDLYIGDVGQGAVEEIDVQAGGAPGGQNYGWRAYEGTSVYSAAEMSRATTRVDPIVAVPHGSGAVPVRAACAIVGGYAYRGAAIPGLRGVYLYTDHCSTDVAALRWCGGSMIAGNVRVLTVPNGTSAFGQDNAGEMYIVNIDGTVRRITAM